jgi:hypothetical protein
MGMTPEEYERIKEAEKEHLRALRRLKEVAREVERRRALGQAINRLVDEPRAAMEASDDAIDRIAIETARAEARFELAVELSQEAQQAIELERFEEDQLRKRAADLLSEVRDDLDRKPDAQPSSDESHTSQETASPPAVPAKSLGRMRPPDEERRA